MSLGIICKANHARWLQSSSLFSIFTPYASSSLSFSLTPTAISSSPPARIPYFRTATARVPCAAHVEMSTPTHAMCTAPSAKPHHRSALARARCHSGLDISPYEGCCWSVQIASMISGHVFWLYVVSKNNSKTRRRAHVETRASKSREYENKQMRVRFR